MATPLQPQDGGGVVVPGGVEANVGADGVQGPVPGLVRDSPVAGAAFVGVGDEAGAEAVGGVAAVFAGFDQAGSFDGGLDDVVDDPIDEPAVEGAVPFADGPEQWAVGDLG